MTCGGCSGAVSRVLGKLDGESEAVARWAAREGRAARCRAWRHGHEPHSAAAARPRVRAWAERARYPATGGAR
jgi:hypothetical protein